MQKKKEKSPFEEGLKRIAKASLESVEDWIVKWWSRKYNLPPTDPRLLDYTMEELLIEYWQDQYIDNPGKQYADEDKDWNGELGEEHEKEMKKRLANLPKVDLKQFNIEKNDEPGLEEFDDRYGK